jgi:transcription-repair coupling factor (superfamily II helicase)
VTHPALRDLLQSLGRHPAFQELLRTLSHAVHEHQPAPLRLAGLTTTAKALYLVLLWQVVQRPLLVVVDGSKQAETLLELLETFYSALVIGRDAARAPQQIPALDVLPFQNLSPHSEIAERRAVGLYRLARGSAPITVAPVGSALLRTETPEFHRQLSLTLRQNDELSMEDFVSHLEAIGYERREPVEMVGEFSIRGGIVDIFPAEASRPVRIEFFGDTVESLRSFDVETQRSVLKLEETTILPLLEFPRSRALLAELGASGTDPFPGWEFHVPRVRPRPSNLFEQNRELIVVIDEPEQVRAAGERLWKRLTEPGRELPVPLEALYLSVEDWEGMLARLPCLELRQLDLEAPTAPRLATRPTVAFHGNMQVAVNEARALVDQGYRVVFFASSTGELERLADIFQEYAVAFQLGVDPKDANAPYLAQRVYAGETASIILARGAVRRGTGFTDSLVALFGSDDLFDRPDAPLVPNVRVGQMGALAADIGDLKPGDFVVHTQHGIGQFLGIREIAQGEQKGDFMLLEYNGGNKLYVPLTRMDLIQKYRGAGDAKPSLDKLGGTTWTKTKARVKSRMRDMAEELLKLYAQRKMTEGYAFSPDSNWQREFEDAFEFTPTRDQLQAIMEIKRDMESPGPMDRLLCGDVGFGKTEVAMRAAFKALGDGKQVAVLAPTTVLAFQHFETFKRRFAAFPVKIEMFSRFRSAKELKAAAQDLATGQIDIAIGTHRLLSADIQFRDLGLLIIDEEQRFGVRHKERLKQLKKNVDTLTMSATPIPRTLHMSMLGLRDLSIIETPPKDRLAIHTVVARYNEDLIRTAIEQELARGGQVYYLHNRVETIFERAARIQQLVPDARVGVGHGQMDETALEKVLLGFMKHEFDVFVCTTIVENGIDIPLANTIIVERAERHGLSELYQLRGRVGRSNRRAYAYLLVPEEAELTDIARKRLAALREFSDLGAGFKIAALDLELRGAGNILGGEQHGHIDAVGYDMYMSLLDQAVRELRGEQVAPEIHTSINLGLDLRIPTSYISDEHQRLRAYKKVADCKTAEEAARILEEFKDRYGPPPEPVRQLLRFAVLKSTAEQLGIETVERKGGFVHFKFHPESRIDPMKLMALVQANAHAQFTPAGVLRIPSPHHDPAQLLDALDRQLQALA